MIDISRMPKPLITVVITRVIRATQTFQENGPNVPAPLTPRIDDRTSGTVIATAGRGQDAGPEVEPAGEQAEGPVRQSLRPLVDRAGDREVAGELGEVEGDEELADDDERPRPEERRPADEEAEADEGERAGRDADVAERDREVRQEAERASQLRLDAQALQVRVIARRLVRSTGWTRHEQTLHLRHASTGDVARDPALPEPRGHLLPPRSGSLTGHVRRRIGAVGSGVNGDSHVPGQAGASASRTASGAARWWTTGLM